MVKISLSVVAATWLAFGALASADPYPQPTPPPPEEPGPAPNTHAPALGIGVAINLGGGLDDFAGSTMRDTTGVGFGWTARALFGTHSFLAGEVSYLGSAQGVDRLGLRG